MAKLILKKEEMLFPKRATFNSAGHDVFAHEKITLNPLEVVEVSLPLEVDFKEDERVFLFLRSSIGIKKNCRFSDENGNIVPYIQIAANKEPSFFLKNIGEETVTLDEGVHYCQLVITKSSNENKEFCLEKVTKVQEGVDVVPMHFRKRENNVQTLFTERQIVLKPKESIFIASGFKAKIDSNTFLAGFVPVNEERFIYSNGVAIGDADYYNNESNEGMYFFKIENVLDETLILEEGTAIVDLMSVEFFVLENEQHPPSQKRTGGIGSTTLVKK